MMRKEYNNLVRQFIAEKFKFLVMIYGQNSNLLSDSLLCTDTITLIENISSAGRYICFQVSTSMLPSRPLKKL